MDLRKRLSPDTCRPGETLNTELTPDHIETHQQQQKVPLRILERRIQSLTQTTIPHDLNRLRQHKENIVSYHRECNWTRLNVEQVNASRTVQQLKTHIQTIDDLQSQVEVSDHRKFVSLTQDTRHDVQRAIEEFGMVQATYTSSKEDEEQQFDQLTTVSDQSVLIPREEAAAQSWEELRKDLLELNELTRALQMEVNEQRKLVSQLECDVDSAAVHTQNAGAQLEVGRRIKGYIFPVGGAIVGGVVGGAVAGPLGALAGLKVGALAAAAAGTAGAIGGAFVGFKAKEHNNRVVDEHEKQH